MAASSASDRRRDELCASMRWTEVHLIKDQTRALKTHLSELIVTVDCMNYDGSDLSRSVDPSKHHDRWIKIQRRIK